LHHIFPEAPLYTSVYEPKRALWAKIFNVRTSFLQRFPFAKRFHRLYVALMPLAFESLDLSQYDIIISVSSAEAKGVLTKTNQLHVCYLLTPTRYLWSHTAEYQKHWLTGPLRKIVFDYLRWWDEQAAKRPDVMIPISGVVAERCRQYYMREPAAVIYPTVTPFDSALQKKTSQTEIAITELPAEIQSLANQYYLIVSRLVPYKKIDLAIQACQKAEKPLVIIGVGPDSRRLKKLIEKRNATAKVFFLQAVQEDQLPAYYFYCRAFLSPAEEDFGMTVVEAQQFGKPVVIYAKSGGAEVVEEGRAGLHFFAQTVNDLSEAIHIVESLSWNQKEIQSQAMKLGTAQFQKSFKNAVEKAWHERMCT
jgi:glycosyltransferase involved in cell wall biosynthesis